MLLQGDKCGMMVMVIQMLLSTTINKVRTLNLMRRYPEIHFLE